MVLHASNSVFSSTSSSVLEWRANTPFLECKWRVLVHVPLRRPSKWYQEFMGWIIQPVGIVEKQRKRAIPRRLKLNQFSCKSLGKCHNCSYEYSNEWIIWNPNAENSIGHTKTLLSYLSSKTSYFFGLFAYGQSLYATKSWAVGFIHDSPAYCREVIMMFGGIVDTQMSVFVW